ncbi:hypothetical protein [Sanguibacter sp. 26GB23]|uniref:hypothetical protein n=1 Tax=Sanguibacter sp. 26GB23 TaxID=3156066 RepID=UPI0032AF4C38
MDALALAVAAVVALAPGAAPYDSGPYAGGLCPTEGVGSSLCTTHRQVRAAVQGAEHRADALADGGTCEQQSGLWVCFGVTSVLAQRGGTTYGDTFLTARDRQVLDDELVAHELEHVRQWRLFGPSFTVLYLREGSDPCENYFEVQAGLALGGYECS